MDTLQITKANAIKAYQAGCPDVKGVLANLFGRETFEPRKITDRMNTLADVFEAEGLSASDFYEECANLDLPKDEIAYRLLKLIVKVLNEGWVPNWNDSSERKWRPYFFLDFPGFRLRAACYVNSLSSVGSRLCFKSEELALYAAKTFLDVYKDFFTA